jgi:hypothetical protein
MANDAVAAGEGALETWIILNLIQMLKIALTNAGLSKL